jgi:hypothetical protein
VKQAQSLSVHFTSPLYEAEQNALQKLLVLIRYQSPFNVEMKKDTKSYEDNFFVIN